MLHNITTGLHQINKKLNTIEKILQNQTSHEELGIKNNNDILYLKQIASEKIKEQLNHEFPDGYITFSDFPGSHTNKFPKKNNITWENHEYYLAIKLDYIIDFLNFDITYNSILNQWTINYFIPEELAILAIKQIDHPKTSKITYQAEELLSNLSKVFTLVNKKDPKKTINVESFIKENLDNNGYYLDSTIHFDEEKEYSKFLNTLKRNEEQKIIAQKKMEFQAAPLKSIVVFEENSFESNNDKSMTYEFLSRDITHNKLNNQFQNIYSKEPVTFSAKIYKPNFLKMLFFHKSSYDSFKSFNLKGHVPVYNNDTIRFYDLINEINYIVYKIHEKFNKQSHMRSVTIKKQ